MELVLGLGASVLEEAMLSGASQMSKFGYSWMFRVSRDKCSGVDDVSSID